MNKKGFTLIELISIILLLGIIAVIAVPTVNTLINKSKDDSYEEQIRIIERSARTYMADNSLELPDDGKTIKLSLDKLKEAGLLSKEDIKNPKKTKETLTGCVKVTNTNEKYNYKYTEEGC